MGSDVHAMGSDVHAMGSDVGACDKQNWRGLTPDLQRRRYKAPVFPARDAKIFPARKPAIHWQSAGIPDTCGHEEQKYESLLSIFLRRMDTGNGEAVSNKKSRIASML